MKKLKRAEVFGFSQIFVLLGMLLVAVALPVAIIQVQKVQENRSSAAGGCISGSTKCEGMGVASRCVDGVWKVILTCSSKKCDGNSCRVASTSKTCSGGNGYSKCENNAFSTCDTSTGKWGSSSACPSGQICNSTNTACTNAPAPETPECTNGKIRCVDKGQLEECISSHWAIASKCTSEVCNSDNTGCGTAPALPTCTYTCTLWSDCSNLGNQTCSNQKKSPDDCTGGDYVIGDTRKCCYGGDGNKKCEDNKMYYCNTNTASWSFASECANGTACNSAGTACAAIKKCSGGDGNKKCEDNKMYYCNTNTSSWSFASECANGTACNSAGTACDPTACSPNGKIRCTGSGQLEECILSNWATATKCTSGVCNSDKTGCDTTACSPNGKIRCTGSGQLEECILSNWATATKCTSGKCKSDGTGCGTDGGGDPQTPTTPQTPTDTVTIPATAIKLSPTTLSLKVGQSAVVTATITPINSTDKVIWSSDDGKVATVTADGVITAVKIGQTTIRALTTSGIEATVAVKVISSETLTLSFKISFSGIKPYYKSGIGSTYSCIGELGDLKVEILNRPTNTYKSYSGVQVAVVGNEVDPSGNQVFQVTNLEIGSEFASLNTFNNVKVKGPFHLKRKMCLDGQTGKVDETTVCNIDLTNSDYVYDFTKYVFSVNGDSVYGLLPGDVDGDGMINSVDFSYVKNAWAADATPECGRQYDLNLDGVVNHIDKQLVLTALSFKDDE